MKRGLILTAALIIGVGIVSPSDAFSAQNDQPRIPERLARILEKVRHVYTPLIEARGGRFVIEERWWDPALGANVDRQGRNGEIWLVGISAGMFTHRAVTDDAFRFAICHELGHLFGGAPRKPLPEEWNGPAHEDGKALISAEGEADYYANLKCMRYILAEEDNLGAIAAMDVPQVVKSQCDSQYPDAKDSALCQRITIAAKSFLDMFSVDFPSAQRPVYSFETPATEVVEKTNSSFFPRRQCRLDTAVAGALCRADLAIQPDSNDPTVGTCTRAGGFSVGLRPACWFLEP